MQAMKTEREGILVTELLMKGARISSPQKKGASNKLLFPTAFIGKPNDAGKEVNCVGCVSSKERHFQAQNKKFV